MKECQNIDFKETWNDEYLKWIYGFANTQGRTLCADILHNAFMSGIGAL